LRFGHAALKVVPGEYFEGREEFELGFATVTYLTFVQKKRTPNEYIGFAQVF